MNNRTKEELWSCKYKDSFRKMVSRLENKFRSRKDLLARLHNITDNIYMVKQLGYNVCGVYSEKELIQRLQGVTTSFDPKSPLTEA